MSSVGVRAPSQRIRVFVVEEDPRLRALLRWVLDDDRRFVVVGAAARVEEAESSLTEFDVALLDLHVSGLEGSGVISTLRHHVPPPLVVVLSVSGARYLRYAAQVAGVDGFLVRPDDLGQLCDRLRELVEQRWPSAGGDREPPRRA